MGIFWDKVTAMRLSGTSMKKAAPKEAAAPPAAAAKRPKFGAGKKAFMEKENPAAEPAKPVEKVVDLHDKGTDRASEAGNFSDR